MPSALAATPAVAPFRKERREVVVLTLMRFPFSCLCCAKAFCRVQRESDRIRLQAHDTLADVLLRESPMALSQMRLNDSHHAPYLASQADTFGAFYT